MTDKEPKNDQQPTNGNTEQNKPEKKADNKPEIQEDIAEKRETKHKDQHKLKREKYLEKIAELEDVIAEMKDRHLRLQAEFDNFRKRTLREKAELIKSGGESVLSGILPIIDDVDRAMVTMKDVHDDDPAKIGTQLIFVKFKDFLKQNNVKEIEATGKDFNVDLHFALSKIAVTSDEQKGKVVDVVEKGYILNDKVIRFAKVIIGE